MKSLTDRLAKETQRATELAQQLDESKMSLHEHQLKNIKMTSKYDELRRKGHLIEAEFKKLQSKLRETSEKERNFELDASDLHGMSEQSLSKVESHLFRGL